MELGIDFGGTAVKLGLFEGSVAVSSDTFPVRGDAADLEAAGIRAAALVREEHVSAVGIAMPGVVERDGRRMLQANDKYAFLRDVDLVAWADRVLHLPAVVENDARAALVGEVSGGCAGGARDAVMVTLGTGIGTAAMIDGALVRGAHGHAGILGGHVTVDLHGPACPCGNLGCAEALASTRALREEHPELRGLRDVVAGAAASAELAGLLQRYVAVWGAAVVTMCHMYDPDVVVLSGGVLRAGDAVRTPIEEYVRSHLWSSAHRPSFVVPDAPEHSAARGAAALAAQALAAAAAAGDAAPAPRMAATPSTSTPHRKERA